MAILRPRCLLVVEERQNARRIAGLAVDPRQARLNHVRAAARISSPTRKASARKRPYRSGPLPSRCNANLAPSASRASSSWAASASGQGSFSSEVERPGRRIDPGELHGAAVDEHERRTVDRPNSTATGIALRSGAQSAAPAAAGVTTTARQAERDEPRVRDTARGQFMPLRVPCRCSFEEAVPMLKSAPGPRSSAG